MRTWLCVPLYDGRRACLLDKMSNAPQFPDVCQGTLGSCPSCCNELYVQMPIGCKSVVPAPARPPPAPSVPARLVLAWRACVMPRAESHI